MWDHAVRVLHWTLVAGVVLAWLSTLAALSGIGSAHQPAGYVALGAALLRLLWGFGPSRYARFSQFVRGPRATLRYARALPAHHEPRYLGHNPLGAWMVLALLACVLGLAFTGWLYTTDRFWGGATVDTLHTALAWLLVGLAALHVSGVVFTSLRQRENLIAAMLHGRKPAAREGDIT